MAKLGAASVAGGLLVAGVMMPVVGGAGVVAKTGVDSFQNQECDTTLLDQPPAQRSVIKASDGTPIASLFLQNRVAVPLGKIPEWTRKAIVAIEDRRFYEHHGLDPTGTFRALVDITKAGEVTQGGSTLTQQYVKNVLLYSAGSKEEQQAATEQTVGRKLREAKCALALEENLTQQMGSKRAKEEIIGRYLNIVNFGSGAYGIATASQAYFGTTPEKLSLSQSAMLAGLVNSPTRYNPIRHPDQAKKRRQEVLKAMLDQGYIKKDQYDQANKEPLVPPNIKEIRPPGGNDCANANANIPNVGFFCDYVKEYLAETLKLSADQLQRGGMTINTTIDPKMQTFAQAAVDAKMDNRRDLNAAAVMNLVDVTNGKVRAMAITRTYGIPDAKNPARTVDPIPWEPYAGSGSTNKVFTLIAALRNEVPVRGFTITTPDGKYKPENCPQDAPEVGNAGDYPDTLDLERATYMSSNTFFEALIDQKFDCDLTATVKAARDMGMTRTLGVPEANSTVGDLTVAEHRISFTLGPNKTSALEMASAYGTIANDGVYCPPTPIESILGPDGKPLTNLPRVPGCEQRIEPEVAHTAAQVLKKDVEPGHQGQTGQRAHVPGHDIGGKTGTAQSRERGAGNASAWFIGFTRKYSASVALLNPKRPSDPLTDVPGFDNDRSGEIFGGRIPAGVWHDAMAPILEGTENNPFPPEDDRIANGDTIPVPGVEGQPIDSARQILESAGFQVRIGNPVDSFLPPHLVAEQSPRGRAPAGTTVTLHPGTGRQGGGGGGGGGGICLPGAPRCNPPGGGGGGGGGGICLPTDPTCQGGGGGGGGGGDGDGSDGGGRDGDPVNLVPVTPGEARVRPTAPSI